MLGAVGSRGECSVRRQPGTVGDVVAEHVVDGRQPASGAVVVDALKGALIPGAYVGSPSLRVGRGIPWLPRLTGGGRWGVVQRWDCHRRIEGCDVRNSAEFGDRARCVLVRIRAENHVASLRRSADGVELVGDQIRHRFAEASELLRRERCRRAAAAPSGPMPHLHADRNRFEPEATNPLDEVGRNAQPDLVTEVTHSQGERHDGLHIAPCLHRRQQSTPDHRGSVTRPSASSFQCGLYATSQGSMAPMLAFSSTSTSTISSAP
jgi:hypothetical protein